MATSDPLKWAISDVVHYFRCVAADVAKKARPTIRLPDLDAFADKLEENEVDGPVLFEDVDKAFLKDDCGIKTLAQRSAVIFCISQLKARSQQLSPQAGTPAPQTPASPTEQPVQLPRLDHPTLPRTPPEPSPGEKIRKGEEQVEDARGRKRRKLDLTKSSPVQTDPFQRPAAPASFLGDVGRPVDELFFGKTPLGGEVGDLCPDAEIVVTELDRQDPESELVNFQFQAPNKLPGEVEYVYGRMRHFFGMLAEDGPDHDHRDVRQIVRNGHPAVSIVPYQRSIIGGDRSQSALVFQQRGSEEEAVVIRENAAYLDTDINYNGLPQEPNNGAFDYLIAKWKQNEDDVMSDLDRDEAVSISESLEDELEQEEREDQEQALKGERLAKIIDQGIAELEQKIKEKKLPIWEKRAWTEWKKTKQSRTVRAELIAGANRIIQQLARRMDKLKEGMLDEEWASESQVLNDCERMEATVEDIEKQRWKIKVWKRKQEPAHEVQHRQHSGSQPTSTKPSDHTGFQVQPGDRFSVEPASPVIAEDQDDFHSARGSPAPGAEDEAIGQDEDEDASDEMSPHDQSGDETMEDDFIAAESPIQLPSSPQHSNYSDEEPVSPTPKAKEATDQDSDSGDPENALANFRNSVKPEKKTPVKQSMPSSQAFQNSPIEISSDSTPAKSGRKKRTPNKKHKYSDRPLEDTLTEVESWDLEDLARNSDRIRMIIKLLHRAGKKMRKRMADRIRELRLPKFNDAVQNLLAKMRKDWNCSTDPTLQLAAKLFLAWTNNLPSAVTDPAAPDIPWASIKTDALSISVCTNVIQQVLNHKKLWGRRKPTPTSTPSKSTPAGKASMVIDLLDSSDEDDDSASKRKKKPVLNDAAAHSQFAAFERQKRSKALENQASNSQELQAMIQADPSRSTVPINLATKSDDDDLIFIHKNIAQQLKEHQIAGIRFMWRELTAKDDDDEDGDDAQGCILAHTMGLGKTVQTIAVLVAINEAAQSNNTAVSQQIPKHLRPRGINKRQLRMLILCPASLIQNWRSEIKHWAQDALTNIFTVEAGMQSPQYMEQLRSWYKVGGVLLMGYEIFRKKVKSATEKDEKIGDIASELEKYLIQAPELVVADEAHMLKNDGAAISRIAGSIRTHARIGLTGTPMSNDVDEIYSLISFAAPNFLGEKTWFNRMFSRPIKEGNSYDSTASQIRRSLKKLAVLRAQIGPKVDRKDITVLRGSLKPKVEFVITLPLTDLQREIYNGYLGVVLGDAGRASETSQVKIFSWLAVLTLLTNHPLTFKQKLLEPPKPPKAKSKAKATAVDSSREPTPNGSDSGAATPAATEIRDDDEAIADLDGTVRALGLSRDAINSLTANISDDDSPGLSAKMSMLFEILRLAKQCGDKVLVFSSKIPTLDYVQHILTKNRIKCGRIDGSVPTAKRQQIVEAFDQDRTEVMIISTKAGGVGLNIQRANRVVILDFGFNPSHEEQAIGRAYRLGQQKPVFVYRLIVGGTFEDEIYNKQMFKTSLTQRVVDKKNPRRNATGTASTWLYPPKDPKQKDLNEYVGMDKVLDSILQRQLSASQETYKGPAVRALTTIETLQEDANDLPLNDEEQREVEAELAERLRERQSVRKVSGLTLSQSAMPPPGMPSTAPAKNRAVNGNGVVPRAGRVNPPAQGLSRMVSFPLPSTPHGLPLPPPRQNQSQNGAAGPSSTAPSGRPRVRG